MAATKPYLTQTLRLTLKPLRPASIILFCTYMIYAFSGEILEFSMILSAVNIIELIHHKGSNSYSHEMNP